MATTPRTAAVVGGGIIGAAVAGELVRRFPDAAVTLVEKEAAPALHQSGRSSGVVHAGLYYPPGSLKATLCRRGVHLVRELAERHELPYAEIGKILVALDADDLARLDDIEERARANGVPGVRRVGAGELRELEPHVRGVGGLLSPRTAITDYAAVTRALTAELVAAGGTVRLGTTVVRIGRRGGQAVVRTTSAAGTDETAYDLVILCAGVHSDTVAAPVTGDAAPAIVPFKGEYYRLAPDRAGLVTRLVYPVPDPRYPFLGVHLTPRVDGSVLVGPNAVLAGGREAYGRHEVHPRELASILRTPGFAAFARQHWRTGVAELAGSLSRRQFARYAARYVPELTAADLLPGPSGIRAQAMDPDGSLVDDFRVQVAGQVVAVRNAPSPGATSSMAIAEHVMALAWPP